MSTKTYTIQLEVCIDAENEDDVQQWLIEYVNEIVSLEDFSAFSIKETTK